MSILDPSSASPPCGTRVYAIGDIHGRLDLLDQLLERLADDLRRSRPERVVVVVVGDLIDRGPQSRQVIERLASGPPAEGPLAGTHWVCLRGNHEDYLMQFLADFSMASSWFRNGGLEAVRSYLGQIPDDLMSDAPSLQRRLYRALPPTHLRFLSRMPTRHVEGGYLFVHAGIRPGVPLERQDSYDLMWIREPFLSHDGPLDKVVVHGHTGVSAPEIHPHRIAIDTLAYRTGRLTCLVLEGNQRRFLST